MVVLKITNVVSYESIFLKDEKSRLSFRQNLEFADYGETMVEYESPQILFGPTILLRIKHDVRQTMPYSHYIDISDRTVVYTREPRQAVREFSRRIDVLHVSIGSSSASAREMRGRVGAESRVVEEEEDKRTEAGLLTEVYRSSVKDAELGRERIGSAVLPAPFFVGLF